MRSETFEWTGPAIEGRGSGEVSGLAYLSGIRDGIFPPPDLGPLMSAEIVEVARGRVQLICSPAVSAFGSRHPDAGVAWLVLDAAISCVAQSLVVPGQGWVAAHSRGSFDRPDRPALGSLTATAEASESSTDGVLVTAELVDASGVVLATLATTLWIFEFDEPPGLLSAESLATRAVRP